MKRYVTGDVWTDAKLLQAEELAAEARAFEARQALVRESRPGAGDGRRWNDRRLRTRGGRLGGVILGAAGPSR